MPVIKSNYKPPLFLKNCHVQTAFPFFFRQVKDVHYKRERMNTPDGDFIDLDWSCAGSDTCIIIVHGLEASSTWSYMKGMVRACNRRGWDAAAMNMRGCSGEPNRLLRFYHSGVSEDLHAVVCHVDSRNKYKRLYIIGYSLGGNVTLKYLGEKSLRKPQTLKKAAAVSVPCDLTSCSIALEKKENTLYMKRFLNSLHNKIKAKKRLFPGELNDDNYKEIKTFKQYDDRYTAPLHGFKNALDYWKRCSSRPFLNNISIPALLINAKDDPFMGPDCYPYEEAEKNPNFFLEIPDYGGHVGFIAFNRGNEYWHEKRITSFLIDM